MGQLPRDRRITARREIARLLGGVRVCGRELELYWRPASQPRSRATCVTPKFGHTAVDRNRLRRRLKELMRRVLLEPPDGRDFLVRARRQAYDLTFDELSAALEDLAARMDATAGGPEAA